MQAKRRIYDHAPTAIPTPSEFRNKSIEVLFLRIDKAGREQSLATDSTQIQIQQILSSQPAQLSALTLDTTGFKFDREETNSYSACTLQKLFANAANIKIDKNIRIDSLMDEMNDALS